MKVKYWKIECNNCGFSQGIIRNNVVNAEKAWKSSGMITRGIFHFCSEECHRKQFKKHNDL